MGSYVGISECGKDRTAHEAKASDDSEGPTHTCLVNGLAIEDLRFDATNLIVCSCILDFQAKNSIKVGYKVGDIFVPNTG